MIRVQQAKSAAEQLVTAALLGDGWDRALEQLADAAEAGGATLLRLQTGRPLARLSSTGWSEADEALMAGAAPPSPLRFLPERAYEQGGFRRDTDVWAEEELHRDAYFQEFLRPRGVFFHARARLSFESGERVSLSLKRRSRFGNYDAADIRALDSVLPELNAAARIARRVLDAEAFGVLQVLHRRGDVVFELDFRGRLLRAAGEDAEPLGITLRNRRLIAVERSEQLPLERAIARAVGPPHRPALAAITDRRGERRFLQIVPVTGRARDVFLATAAVAVLIEPSPHPARVGLVPETIKDALRLTAREAEIAALIAEGLSLTEIAARLSLRLGTARNHLKSIFDKTGAKRQGEIVALVSKLRP